MNSFVEKCVVRGRAAKRLIMWHSLSKRLPIYLVPEYPKSGGTWFSQMLATALEVPFYRNTSAQPIRSCVMSGHHLFSPNFHNVVVVVRDGRDCIVSAYFHMCFKNEINRQFGVERHRKHLGFKNYDDVQANLPRFIEYLFCVHAKRRFHFAWNEFINSWIDRDFPVVRYEDLLVKPAAELARVVKALTGKDPGPERATEIVDQFSFKNMSGRRRGQESKTSFVRKGVSGDWKNYFSKSARIAFDKYAGDELIQVGYEPNRNWVDVDTN